MIPKSIPSIAFLGSTSLWLGVFPPHPLEAKPQLDKQCNPVGRVVKVAHSQLPAGQLLCRKDTIKIASNKKLRMTCHASGRVITLSPGVVKISDHCGSISNRFRRCTNQMKVGCIIGRNPNASTRATLFVPYSSSVLGGRPSFLWEANPSADQYSVELFLGKAMLWKQTVTGNSMPYPSQVQPLEQGKAYLIRVSAYQGSQTVNTHVSVLNRISTKKESLLKSAFGAIDALKIPAVDKVLDKEKIYFAQGLLSESIEILKHQLRRNPYNPVLHRLVGDRFMNAGLPKLAQPYFAEAKALANKKQDMRELAKANEGLAEIAALPAEEPPAIPVGSEE